MISVFVQRNGETQRFDKVDPAWLEPTSGATLWVDIAGIDEPAGKLSYTGNILFKNGEAQPIADPDVRGNTLLLGPDVLEVQIEPDLIDWTKVKLATVTLSYEDLGNQIAHNDTFTLRKGGAPITWSVGIKDKNKRSYKVLAKYFLDGGARKEIGPTDSTDEVLVLEQPAA